ncbi:hypothetical protein M5K25_018188 [Dendrobium thyrsiflorum]|uniref:Pollen preferential protein n=1 Tax=Dendrobium thyrsiflorum TaxID=117978 RepID=A0ABD0UI21_DENTH
MSRTAAPVTNLPRRQPLILKEPAKPSKRVAEVAGGTTAECAAVVCCCPCGLVNLLVLTIVKLPAFLCRRALRKRKKRRASRKKKAESEASGADITSASPAAVVHGIPLPAKGILLPATSPAAEVSELEKEMWPHFFGNGFWRSPSQRE